MLGWPPSVQLFLSCATSAILDLVWNMFQENWLANIDEGILGEVALAANFITGLILKHLKRNLASRGLRVMEAFRKVYKQTSSMSHRFAI